MGWSSPAVFGTVVLLDKAAKEDKPGESETEAPTEKPGEPETETPTEKPGEPETEAPTQDDKHVGNSVLDRINNGDKIIIEKVEAGKGSYLPNDFVTALIDKGSQLILELTGADGKTLVKYTCLLYTSPSPRDS